MLLPQRRGDSDPVLGLLHQHKGKVTAKFPFSTQPAHRGSEEHQDTKGKRQGGKALADRSTDPLPACSLKALVER